MEERTKSLLLELQAGNPTTIQNRMWQPERGEIDFLPFSLNSILDLKKPLESDEPLSISENIKSENFELLILKKEWIKEEFAFEPLIIESGRNKIIGKVLQFNEITPFLTESQQKEIASLGMKWTIFVIKNKSNN